VEAVGRVNAGARAAASQATGGRGSLAKGRRPLAHGELSVELPEEEMRRIHFDSFDAEHDPQTLLTHRAVPYTR